MTRRKKGDELTFWHVLIGILAVIFGLAKGFSDGMKPPPGDRRG